LITKGGGRERCHYSFERKSWKREGEGSVMNHSNSIREREGVKQFFIRAKKGKETWGNRREGGGGKERNAGHTAKPP